MSSDTEAMARSGVGGETRPQRRSRRRSSSTRAQRVTLAVVLGVGIAVAVTCTDAAPTGNSAIDAAYRAGIMVATIVAGARARRRVLLIAAGLVAIGSDGWMLVPAAVALVLSFVLAWTDRRDRAAGGVAGALIAWAALSLSWPASPTGASAMLAALALVPLWYSGYRVARRSTRRSIRIGVIVGVAVLAVGAIAGAILAATQRSTLLSAADSTVSAARVISAGAGDGTDAAFRENQQQFEAVASAAGSWWAAPSKLVPGVAQNVRAVAAAATAGAELNGVAAELATAVDYDALSRPDGSIDLARLASYEAPATRAADAVGTARTELGALGSPWLVPPVADQLDEFVGHLDEAAGATTTAAEATAALPAILGADGPRRYLLLLGSPAEARDLGGHIGNWAELTAVDGKLDVVRVGEPYELFSPASALRPQLSGDLDLPSSLTEMDPTRFPQNWGASPDLATVARLASDLYPQTPGGAPIDGVMYADPTAFAALLELTGPVEADGQTLSADNAVQFLTKDQYQTSNGGDERSVTPLVRAALDRFTESPLPGPSRIASVFGPVVDAGHLQFVLNGSRGGDLLRRTKLDQPLIAPTGGDLVAVINRNANPSKIDSYLHRTIDYLIAWDPASGKTTSRVIVTMRNDAPASGVSTLVNGSAFVMAPATNRTELSILSPLVAVGAMLDGKQHPYGTRDDVHDLRRYSLVVDLPPGGERTVILDLEGEIDPGPTYHLAWYNQPLPNRDASRVVLDPVGATLPGGGDRGSVKVGSDRVEHLAIEVEVEK